MIALKEVATQYNDIELFKVACEIEKNAGILQNAGNLITGHLKHLGEMGNQTAGKLANKFDTPVSDLIKGGLHRAATTRPAGPLASTLKPISHQLSAATAAGSYRMGDKVIDAATYNRLPIGGFARERFKPVK
jgi:hypothetical protein